MKSKDGEYTSSFGGSLTDRGDINVEVSNIRSQGSGTHSGIGSTEGDVFNINSDEAMAAEGKASVQGIFNNLFIEIDGPSTINDTEIEDLKAVENPITGESLNLDSENREENPIDTANSSSGVRMDSSLNVDIELLDNKKIVKMEIEGSPSKEDISLIAKCLIPEIEDFSVNDNGWLNGYLGIMQIILMANLLSILKNKSF